MANNPAPSLPYVSLKDRAIPLDVLSFIPLDTTEKYQVAAFAATESKLQLAIVHPEALKQGFYDSLKDLGARINKEIVLSQTDAASMQAVIKLYRQGKGEGARPVVPAVGASGKPVPKPPLFELGRTVSSTYMKKVPLDFAKVNHLVCVDFLPPNQYWFVTDSKHLALAESALKPIAEHNDIQAHLMVVQPKELSDLIEHYDRVLKKEGEPVPAPAKAVESAPKEPEKKEEAPVKKEEPIVEVVTMPAPPPPPAVPSVSVPVSAPGKDSEILTPDLQGSILTTEEARPGIAGLFQKVAQSFATEKDRNKILEEEVKGALEAAEAVNKAGAAAVEVKTVAEAAAPVVAGTSSTDKPVTKPDDGDLGKLIERNVETIDELRTHLQTGQVPRIVAAVVNFAIHEKASDVHIEAFDSEVRIRYRIDGQLVDVIKLPADVHAAMVSRIKILSRLRLDETRVPQDGRFDVNFRDVQVDVRVAVMPTVHGEKVVLRILDKSKGISSLETLGIEGKAYETLVQSINRPYGICLATGPTGSGKSTTLYAILNRIATPNVNVVTLEDPVEYEIKGINQSQIKPKIGYTFAEGLRSILRQDPNIIMVGEVRDGETATMATQAALTGHLVLTTLHTNDAAGAIPRLSNMGIEPFLITSSVNIIIGQRLIRRICPHCKSEVNLPQGVKDQIKADLDKIAATASPADKARLKSSISFFQGTGCKECGGKGYLGRLGIYEVLSMSDGIEELALRHASSGEINEQAQKEGMLTMYQDGLLKVVSGITTLDEVLRETATK